MRFKGAWNRLRKKGHGELHTSATMTASDHRAPRTENLEGDMYSDPLDARVGSARGAYLCWELVLNA
jgi:hypothetical protein